MFIDDNDPFTKFRAERNAFISLRSEEVNIGLSCYKHYAANAA